MEQRNFPFLRNWNLSAHNDDVIIKGLVYGHPQITDSRKIKTSPVQKVAFSRENWERLYFYTHNTVYECPMNQVDPTCQFTRKYLHDSLPEESLTWEKWLNDDPTRPETPFENMDLPVSDGAYILALDADSPHLFQGVYQKIANKYHWVIRHPYVNMGMFTDSVLSNKYDGQLNLLFDVRYFPQGVQELRFYGIKFGNENILFYVVNVGNTAVFYDGKPLESWHYFQLLEQTQEEVEEELPPDYPVEELNSVLNQEETRPPLPSRLMNSPYYSENPPDLTLPQEEIPSETMISTTENTEENPEEAISQNLEYENLPPETQFHEPSPIVGEFTEHELFQGHSPENPAEFLENHSFEEYMEQQTEMPDYEEAPLEMSEYVGNMEEMAQYSQQKEELPPRKSLLEEALEFEECSIPPKPEPVELFDEEESRGQVLFSQLALHAKALEEIPLEPNESGQELETFDEIPALNLENFPETQESDIAQLNLGKQKETLD